MQICKRARIGPFPGLILVFGLAAAASLAATMVSGLDAASVALLAGMLLARPLGSRAVFAAGVGFSEKRLLELAVVLLGLGVSSESLRSIGPEAMGVLVLLVVGTLALGYALGRALALPKAASLLCAVGCAICGSAAIAATAPALRARKNDVGLAVGAVNLVGLAALFLLPVGLGAAHASPLTAAWVLGGSLPAVGHVVASGFFMGEQVGEMATVIKMGRVLLLAPWVFLLTRRTREEGGRMPWFALAFVAVVTLAAVGGVPAEVGALGHQGGKLFLAVAMAAIGLGTNLDGVLSSAPRALMVVTVVLALQSSLLFFMGVG